MSKVIVLGGGAAGFFAAINTKIKHPDYDVTILEGTRKTLSKVKVSGGGRCNVTHNCFDPRELVNSYPRGKQELKGPFSRFQPGDTLAWFADRGIDLHAEEDGRMFPMTNSSQTIIDCFLKEVERLGVKLIKGAIIKSIEHVQKSSFKLIDRQGSEYEASHLIMATGSAPGGHELAARLGHKIVEPVPSLFTFNITDDLIKDLPGISFQTANLKLNVGEKKFQFAGPLLVTHWGLSGPAVLKLSAFAARELFESSYKAKLSVNFVCQNYEEVLAYLSNIKENHAQKMVYKFGPDFLVKRFWQRLLEVSKVSEDLKWHDVPKSVLKAIAQDLTSKQMQIDGKGVFKEEFVTCGGVSLGEVDFRTMESRKCPNLYFAGELLDIDGITGGYNFQNAWTTAWIASDLRSKGA